MQKALFARSVSEPGCLCPTDPRLAVAGERLTGGERRIRGTNPVIMVGIAASQGSWLEVEIIVTALAPTVPDQVIGVLGNNVSLELLPTQGGRPSRYRGGQDHGDHGFGVRTGEQRYY